VLLHQFRTDQVKHAPSGFVGHAKLTLQLFRGNPATSACDEVYRVEPQMQGRGRFVEDRSSRRMQVIAASGARPRLAGLFCFVPFEHAFLIALWTLGGLSVRRVTIAP